MSVNLHRASLAFFSLMMLSACESTTRVLVGSEYADVATFAQTTVSVLGVERVDFRGDQLVFLREYVDPESTSVRALRRQLQEVDDFRDQAIRYSVELMRIAEGNLTDAERLDELAETIDRLLDENFRKYIDWSDRNYQQMLTDIRAADSLLAGLRTAQPLINDAGEAYETLIQSIEDETLLAVRLDADAQVERAFAMVKQFTLEQAQRRDRLLKAMSLLSDYRQSGRLGALDELAELNVFWNPAELPTSRFSQAELANAFAQLQSWYLQEQEIYDRVQLDLDTYVRTRQELDTAEERVMAALSVARIQFVSWTRGHQALANGVQDPGKWLEISAEAADVAAKFMP